MDMWDEDFIDLVVPGFIHIQGSAGEFAFGAVTGEMDCRVSEREGAPIVEWSWIGSDEGDEVSGRGWARLDGKTKLVGRLFFHMGDDSGFEATLMKNARPAPRRRSLRD
jgi:hypothetical protein